MLGKRFMITAESAGYPGEFQRVLQGSHAWIFASSVNHEKFMPARALDFESLTLNLRGQEV
jgi:hypothetical protein